MPKATKEKRNPGPSTYLDVSRLPLKELNNLCNANNINIKYGKKAKINILSNKLSITTTGKKKEPAVPHLDNHNLSKEQLIEFQTLTPAHLATLKEWTKDLEKIPDVDESIVKKYLCQTRVIGLSEERMYKLTRPYQLKDFVHSMLIHTSPAPGTSDMSENTFIAVQAQCNASQSSSSDDVKVVFAILDSLTGQPHGGYCTCTVGFCQSCGHIGAVLFQLADLVASGFTQLPNDPSCTDKLCQWTNPKGSNVPPKRLDDIRVKKKAITTQRRTLDEYGANVLPSMVSKQPSSQLILKLRDNLYQATQHLGQHVPAVNVLTPENFSDSRNPTPPPLTVLPDKADALDPAILPARVETVKTKPLPIALHQGLNFSFSDDARAEIEDITKGQSNNVEWFKQKMGSLGGSIAGQVLRHERGAKISTERLVNQVMGYRYLQTTKPKMANKASLKYGIASEPKARLRYTKHAKPQHRDFTVHESGLVVHPTKYYIRASPDGIVSCSCHSRKLLEIKCPSSVKDLDIATVLGENKLKYLVKNENGTTELKQHSSDGYYAQVQTGMAVTGTEACDFVVYTKCDMLVITVPFDTKYWDDELEPALTKFFTKYIVPLIDRQGSVDEE
ncbi:uncharacterized protein LOC135499736 [Lineus longissimus]|uniref:uncharacterized protein LOC135499736 n=1 Tax=Lineus longissimus TaxID=88925 RepID=UPI002B4F762E